MTQLDTENAPLVKLGGKDWPIPMLTARQNMVIDPLILGLLPIFKEWNTDKTKALASFQKPQYEALFEIAFIAVKKGSPKITREQFLDLPITLPELVGAYLVIAEQTGVFAKSSSGDLATEPGVPTTGEA